MRDAILYRNRKTNVHERIKWCNIRGMTFFEFISYRPVALPIMAGRITITNVVMKAFVN